MLALNLLPTQQLTSFPPGVPGVKPDRYEEGLAVKHCALSLVGEPIMYPEINAFIRLLHLRHISSFLVTNAQFPEEIKYVRVLLPRPQSRFLLLRYVLTLMKHVRIFTCRRMMRRFSIICNEPELCLGFG